MQRYSYSMPPRIRAPPLCASVCNNHFCQIVVLSWQKCTHLSRDQPLYLKCLFSVWCNVQNFHHKMSWQSCSFLLDKMNICVGVSFRCIGTIVVAEKPNVSLPIELCQWHFQVNQRHSSNEQLLLLIPDDACAKIAKITTAIQCQIHCNSYNL